MKILHRTITAFSTFAIMSIGFGLSSAKAETTDCTQIISLPAIITAQGIYCFQTNLVTSITTGYAIEIQTNNVTIDMNGFKLGGSTAGTGTETIGFYANGQKNITIKNGNIRGFYFAIHLDGFTGSGHVIEHVRADGNRLIGFQVEGDNNIIRNNHIINTGPSTVSGAVHAIGINGQSLNNSSISNNVISGVDESGQTIGIALNGADVVEVSENSIFDVMGTGGKYGVYLSSSDEIAIIKNTIVNSTIGSIGINDFVSTSHGVDCIENIIREYATGQSGCDYTSGNHIN